ncbi:MAG: hypothetical protein QOG85_108 [Gaiellaceae bacterium]|nr:hypothetical protein [Gaiellaceae bacterium]
MKHFKHPATIIAMVALFAALAGGAGAAMTTLISGSQIQNHTIPVTKLTASALKALMVTGAAHSDGGGDIDCPLNSTGTPTFCGNPTVVKFNLKTVVLVNGDVDLASSDGGGITAELGVCYAPHLSSSLTEVDHTYPEFAAAADSFFAQGVTGTVGGLSGTYDVGVCLHDESSNVENGHFAITMLTMQTSTGKNKALGPS